MEFPSKWIAHCHCTLCQRSHGAAFVTWVSVEESRATIQDPQGLLHWYASSREAERGFCSRCGRSRRPASRGTITSLYVGSSLFSRSSKWPGKLHIARANFSDPLDREPQVHGYYDTHADWFAVNDNLRKKPAPGS